MRAGNIFPNIDTDSYDPARYAGAYAHGYPDLAPYYRDPDPRAYGRAYLPGYPGTGANGRGYAPAQRGAYATGDQHPDDAHGAGAYVPRDYTFRADPDTHAKHRADEHTDALPVAGSPVYRHVYAYPYRPYQDGFWDYAQDAQHGRHCAYPGLHWN